jgi:hypothetical protein
MSLPTIEDHNCANCVKSVPACGRKRLVKEGYCTAWIGGKPT